MTELFGLSSGQKSDGKKLLLTAVSMTCGLTQLPEIRRSRWGKPWFPAYPGLHFNLSHTGTLLLCALSDRPVGADIERIRPRSPLLLEQSLTPAELAWCRQQADPWPRFYNLWTRRESACKRTGRGLTFPVSAISVPCPPQSEQDGLRWQDYSGPGWAAALCGEGVLPPDIQWLDVQPETSL